MSLKTPLFSIFHGTAIISAMLMTIPQIAMALPANEVSKIAKEITVLINNQNPGSGVIFKKEENTYYVLTAKHVVETDDQYTIQTADGNRYPLKYSNVKKLPQVDLAVLQFTSSKNYPIAKLADSDQIGVGVTIHIAGFPNPGREITQRIYQLTSGEISGRPEPALRDGYALIYTNITRAGMSGGPVLDANGRVVGIHGRAEGDVISINELGSSTNKSGFNLGIPINTFLNIAPTIGLNGLHRENSPATDQITPFNPSTTVKSPIPNPPKRIFRRPQPIVPIDTEQQPPICAGTRC